MEFDRKPTKKGNSPMTSLEQRKEFVSLSLYDIDLTETHRRKCREEFLEMVALQDSIMTENFGHICPECGAKLYRHGKTKAKEVWTLSGLVNVSLLQLYCSTCHFYVVPAKQLIADPLCSSLAEKFIDLAKITTFADSRHLLNKLLGIDIPVMTLHAYVRSQSQYFSDEIVRATEALYTLGVMPDADVTLDKGCPLYLCIDEGLMHEWTYCRRQDTPPDKKRYVTAYAAVFFDGRKCVSGKNVAKENRRYALTKRYVHASAATEIDSFFRELVCLSLKRGLTSSHPLYVLTDGARYLTQAVATHFPCATLLLDLFHLRHRIEELIAADSDYYRHINQALYAYDAEELYRRVKNYVVTDEVDTDKKERLLGYIKRNEAAIYNHRKTDVRVHGSSAAEKTVDLLIARRFKRRGMSWTVAGVETLLQFRVLEHNGELEKYWWARHRQELVPRKPYPEAERGIRDATKPSNTKGRPHYYNQVHLTDCERTKGVNVS